MGVGGKENARKKKESEGFGLDEKNMSDLRLLLVLQNKRRFSYQVTREQLSDVWKQLLLP